MLVKLDNAELRILREEDVPEMVRVIKENLDHLKEYLDFVVKIDTENQKLAIKKWDHQYRYGEGFEAGIFVEGAFVGMCGLRIDANDNRGEIGYWLSQAETGRGLMTQMVKEVIDIGFYTYFLHKITIKTVDDNYKSQGIPKRLGFKFDGVLREHQKLHGKYRDLYVFSVLRREWSMFYGYEED